MGKYEFEYFHGKQADQFSFFKIPKLLFTEEIYSELSFEARFLYGILLDTMSLSVKNGWVDTDGRVYVMYGIDSVCKLLKCKKDKARKIFSELDNIDGIGLIEKVKQGQGKPDRIYVKNFILSGMGEEEVGGKIAQSYDYPNENMGLAEMEPGGKNDRSEKPQSRERKISSLDGGNFAPNNTKNNNTEYIPSINLSVADKQVGMDRMDDKKDDARIYRQIIQRHTHLQTHLENDEAGRREAYRDLVELICDVVCGESDHKLSVNGAQMSREMVKSRFLKLEDQHLEYVLDCLEDNPNFSGIRNIRNYKITCLYNAPVTMGSYYQQLYNHHGATGMFGN